MRIEVLDLHFQGRPECVASFLLSEGDTHVLLECGPASTRPALLEGLARLSLQPADVAAVIVSHIHLDHAGDAGWWTAQGKPVYVHEFGAQHLLDPSKLLASATRIYGDRMQELWGEVLPAREGLVRRLTDGVVVEVGPISLQAVETPGHATHHMAMLLGEDVLFAGDVGGVRLPRASFLSVPAPPPEFSRELWLSSLERLAKLPLKALYLTHFGKVEPAGEHLAELAERIQAVTEFVAQRRGLERAQLVEEYMQWHRDLCPDAAAFDRYEQANPLFMSVDGLLRYFKKKELVA